MLQHGPQDPSTNNSAGAKEPLKPGEQATSLPLTVFFLSHPHSTIIFVSVRNCFIHKILHR